MLLTAAAANAAPVVYEDDYITVHSGLSEVGLRALHLGDALSLVVAVEFDGDAVQVEDLDDAWFQRAFVDTAAIRVQQSAATTMTTLTDGRVRVATRWQLQFLDCPEAAPSCAGSKSYGLPIVAVAYRLTAPGGSPADSRSARFRPWPGTVVLASALPVEPGPSDKFADVFPGGAYPNPIAVEAPGQSATMLLLAGALFLGGGILAGRQVRQPQQLPMRVHRDRRRWETAIAVLADADKADDEWSDLLRRALTWYCLDELDSNPFDWLASETSDSGLPREFEAAKSLFLDVLQQERIAADRREEFLRKLRELTATNVAVTGERP
ncbi:MAG: hypothetical protein KJO82_14620 [Gammaproteobacteria bacterium]|nr:hypothetical protein [Gammaproteobacteria bacterium]